MLNIGMTAICIVVALAASAPAETPHCVSDSDTVFVWNPLPGLTTYYWSDQNHWGGSDHPDTSNECAWIADVDPASTCTYDLTTGNMIGSVRLQGSDPTKMRLHVQGGPLYLEFIELYNYAHLDVDHDVDVNKVASIRDDVWIDIDNANDRVCLFDAGVFVDSTTATLHVTNTDLDGLITHDLNMDVENGLFGGNRRILRFQGGKLKVDGTLKLQGSLDSDLYRASFHLMTGEVQTEFLDAYGGDTLDKRASLDLDESMTVTGEMRTDYVVAIAIAPGKQLKTKVLKLGIDTVLTVDGETGGGLPQGKLVAED